MSLGMFIKAKRKELGLSQMALGKLCDTSDSVIQRIEKGETPAPKCDLLCKVAEALQVHPVVLLKEAGFFSEQNSQSDIKFYSVESLTNNELESVQSYIDFLIYSRGKKNSLGGE